MRLTGSGKRLILYSLLMQYTGDPVHPDWQVAAQRAMAEAAGAKVIDGELPEAVNRQLAQALLVSVWHCGAYFLVSPKD